jgi:hypothetical protein
MPRPAAIVSVSAHWYVPETRVTANDPPPTSMSSRSTTATGPILFPVEGFGGSVSMLSVRIG